MVNKLLDTSSFLPIDGHMIYQEIIEKKQAKLKR